MYSKSRHCNTHTTQQKRMVYYQFMPQLAAKMQFRKLWNYSQVKIQLNPQKLLQKVSQLILVGFSVLFNILKVYQSRTPGSVFSRWRPRWPPKPVNDHNSVTINSNLMILPSWCLSLGFGGKEHIKIIKNDVGLLCNTKIQYDVKNGRQHLQMTASP